MITIYGASMSPFVRKTLVVAAEKGLPIEHKPVGLRDKDPVFQAASPFRKIPAMADGDYMLADSSAIVHYMEAVQPAPAMIPAEAKARGKVVWYDEMADTIFIATGGKMFFNRLVAPMFMGMAGDEAVASKAETEELPPILAYLESVIPASGFLVGDSITLADISVTSGFINLDHIGYELDAGAYPKLAAYLAAIKARPSFATLIAAETAMLAKLRG